jgi:hypothetical protein
MYRVSTRFEVVFAIGLAACSSSGSTAASGGDASIVDGAVSVDAGRASPDGSTGRSDGALVDAHTGSHDGGTPDTSDASGHACKRGIASPTPPSSSFAASAGAPRVAWWYDWSTSHDGGSAAIEFVPMVWGSTVLGSALPAGSRYVLGFNEPNFKAQSDLTPAQAAADWPMVEAQAKAISAALVSPAVNYCGSASDPSACSDPTVTDPYTYLSDFFAACTGCEVDYVAVHWYNCDLPSLEGYIDGNELNGGSLPGFVQFGKPIWLTEFACDGTHSVAEQQAYMEAAVPYLEGNPNVFRYSWFSSSNIASALLENPDGSPTALGTTYAGLAQSCP